MNGILVDSNVLLDLLLDDPQWASWSENILDNYSQINTLYINSIIYSEISIGFKKIEDVEKVIEQMGLKVLEIPREALFLAGKVFLQYRRNKGSKQSTLPDFFIGAHAAVSSFDLITRDVSRYRTYYPKVNLISPQ